MKNLKVYKSLLAHLGKSELVWAQSMVFLVSGAFKHDMKHCLAIANKLGTRYPYFKKLMYDNWGLSPD